MKVPRKIYMLDDHVFNFVHDRAYVDGSPISGKDASVFIMNLLHDYGYPDDELHRMPPMLYHYESLSDYDIKRCLYTVIDYLNGRGFEKFDPAFVYCGTHFAKFTDQGYKFCYNVSLVDSISGNHVCSSLCTIDQVTAQVHEYIGYHRSYSHIVIN